MHDLTPSERRSRAIFDVIFGLCLAAALGFTFGLLGCAAPPVRWERVARGQVSRPAVDLAGRKCRAWLPLILEVEDHAGNVLAASRPWSRALDADAVVPALDGERPTLRVTFEPCPRFRKDGTCGVLADTASACEGDVLVSTIELFSPGDDAYEFFVWMHELGHALGVQEGGDRFGHSRAEWSIMYPTIDAEQLMDGAAGPDDETKARAPQWVRPDDERAARAAWGIK